MVEMSVDGKAALKVYEWVRLYAGLMDEQKDSWWVVWMDSE
eukprot:CAMPEP_0170099096 /NCGR_PEP_ID=MMETSP0020_2-20130122/825_1 /TAXON_ID=98059 /ORGANISM="Dinobryon sp., Strain UTEXLB2267" /LENGTH=40 /DNA_ID= /DNA_START= /DNA_END= /DNA_ORIENTATION=